MFLGTGLLAKKKTFDDNDLLGWIKCCPFPPNNVKNSFITVGINEFPILRINKLIQNMILLCLSLRCFKMFLRHLNPF